jgi:hypothetical protein
MRRDRRILERWRGWVWGIGWGAMVVGRKEKMHSRILRVLKWQVPPLSYTRHSHKSKTALSRLSFNVPLL